MQIFNFFYYINKIIAIRDVYNVIYTVFWNLTSYIDEEKEKGKKNLGEKINKH